jgi:hypothetical protein
MNIKELVNGNHVHYEEMIKTETEHKLSGERKKGKVIAVVDENKLKIEVEGKEVVADREQIFPIQVTEELLLSIGFIKEAGLLKKVMNPFTPIQKSLVVTPGSDEPFSILIDNQKGYSALSKVEEKYPSLDFLERFWYKESGNFSIYS